ncbi:MAG: hypothetical protein R3Y58_07315 [Eubacteriales bacterium]
MFDVFGEFDSWEEINMAADGLFNEGDLNNIKVLAKENGIPEELVTMFTDGEIPTLCDAETAAIGKIEVESAELKVVEIMSDWVEYIKSQCMANEKIRLAVRRKNKNLKGCIAEILKWSFKNQNDIDKDIIKAAGVSASRVTLGIPGMGTAKKMIKKYYLG